MQTISIPRATAATTITITITNTTNTTITAKLSFLVLFEISNLLHTGLDREALSTCVSLCESGVNPEALAAVIKELRRESRAIHQPDPQPPRSQPEVAETTGYEYAVPVNENLICCICHAPFVDPVTIVACGHTFCRHCLDQAVVAGGDGNPAGRCPVDRQPLGAETEITKPVMAAPLALQHMVNELMVFCPRVECRKPVQRQHLDHHVRQECMADKRAQEPVVCAYCGLEVASGAEDALEHEQTCPDKPVRCVHSASLGCPWQGRRDSLEQHVREQCAYEPLKHCLQNLVDQQRRLGEENRQLRQQFQTALRPPTEELPPRLADPSPQLYASFESSVEWERLAGEQQQFGRDLDGIHRRLTVLERIVDRAVVASSDTLRIHEELHALGRMVQILQLELQPRSTPSDGQRNKNGSGSSSSSRRSTSGSVLQTRSRPVTSATGSGSTLASRESRGTGTKL